MEFEKKFVEVLSEVVRELIAPQNQGNIKEAEKRVVESLVKKGYGLSEIADMLEEIFEKVNTLKKNEFKMRVLHSSELQNLNQEAKDYLLDLKRVGIVDDALFEDMIAIAAVTEHNKLNIDWVKNLLKIKGIDPDMKYN